MFNQSLSPRKIAPAPATVYFLAWLQERALTPQALKRAEQIFDHLVKVASPLGRLKSTPQTPPWHAESEMVSGHVLRMLAGLDAFEHDQTLAEIEEIVREKDYLLEFQELEAVFRGQSAFLAAYAVCHDLAKADTVVFEAQTDSKCEAEGFATHDLRLATEPERVRYDKLRRAHAASQKANSFYADHQITVHYQDHARSGAADEYASTREAVLNFFDLPASRAKLLTELIRCHMDVILAFKHGPDPLKYRALATVAERVGLNAPVFLDLLPATLFLDAVLGSLIYAEGEYRANLALIINLFKSEREAMPDRHAAREAALHRGQKQALRDTLKEALIDADSVFALLHTSYGPVRGQVMAKIHELINNPAAEVDFGDQTAVLIQRARHANALLAERHLTLS